YFPFSLVAFPLRLSSKSVFLATFRCSLCNLSSTAKNCNLFKHTKNAGLPQLDAGAVPMFSCASEKVPVLAKLFPPDGGRVTWMGSGSGARGQDPSEVNSYR